MSAPMKKPLTETIIIGRERLQVPRDTAKAMLVLLKGGFGNIEKIPAEESQTIKQLDALYTRAGACLHGARIKEGLSQMALAEKIGISQTNLSKMEVGKRPIGKAMAKRIATILKVNYRIFL